MTLLAPKVPAGPNYSAKYTTVDREGDASNKSCISLARNSAVPAASLVCEEHDNIATR